MSAFLGGTEVAGASLPCAWRRLKRLFFRASAAKCAKSAVFGMLILAGPAQAQSMTSGELYAKCADVLGDTAMIHQGLCVGYISGVIDDLITNGPRMCWKRDLTLGDFEAIYVEWSNRHRAEWDDNAAVGVLASIVAAYPCK